MEDKNILKKVKVMELFDQIRESTEAAKARRTKALSRFNVGDVVYPLYQRWSIPALWGIVVKISPEIRKIVVDLQGCERQYDPEELIPTSPELRPNSSYNEDREKSIAKIEKNVKASFSRFKKAAPLGMETFGEDEEDILSIAPLEDSEERVKVVPAFTSWKIAMERVSKMKAEVSDTFESFISDSMNFIQAASLFLASSNMNKFRENAINALYSFSTAISIASMEKGLTAEHKTILSTANDLAKQLSKAMGVILQ